MENETENVLKLIEVPAKFFEYLSSEACDLQKICRLCLKVAAESDSMVPLLPNDTPGNLVNQLQSFSSVVVLPDMQLPTHTCEVCAELILKCYEFKLQCEHTDLTIKSVLKGEFVKDEPIEDVELIHNHNMEPDNDMDGNTFEYIPIEEELERDWKEEKNDITISETQLLSTNTLNAKQKSKKLCIKSKRITPKRSKAKPPEAVSERKQEDIASLYQCNICTKEFPKNKLLQVHIKHEHSEEKVINCNKCKLTFASERDYNLHTSLHTAGRKLKCIECQKEFTSKTQLRRHIQRHMEHKKYPCDICTKSFSEHCALTRHRRTHTGQVAEKKHICGECGKRFTYAAALRDHSHVHTGERPCECARCGKRFLSARLLASHMLVHEDTKPHQCHYCERRFRHESTRTAHHRTHTGERPYVCSACGKTFMQSSNLTLHMRKHTGEKPYRCGVCQRSFSSGSSLKNHARTHTGEKPFECAICGKRFARVDLNAHMLRHSGQRPHGCRACGKRFYTASRLRRHAAACRQAGAGAAQQLFECAKCDERFMNKSHLVRHIKTHDDPKRRNRPHKELLLVHRVTDDTPYLENVIVSDKDMCAEEVVISQDTSDTPDNMTVALTHEIPMEPYQEIPKTGLIVVENVAENCQQNCITQDGVCLLNLDNTVNLVTVSEGTTIEGTNVKLYQLDQSLVQIHTSGGQVTISKITSKVTANFE